MSDTLALYHIVFCTYHRQMTIPDAEKRHLYKFIWEKLKAKQCHLYRINGIANHVHVFINLNPSIALSALVGELKRSSSIWMKQSGRFPAFTGWGKEYYAHTVGAEAKDKVIEYIRNQENHHISESFEMEFKTFCDESGIEVRFR